MKLIYRCTNIEYDFENETNIRSPEDVGASTEMDVKVDMIDEDDNMGDIICTALTNETGWLIKTFDSELIDVVDDNGKSLLKNKEAM